MTDFVIATLRAANSTVSLNGTDNGNNSDSSPSSARANPNTGLAMIILYAITGCVSGLFIIVILSGAVRAMRHPERYGPRAAGVNGGGGTINGQSRTGGIGRAILDTFPVIKFGQNAPATQIAPKNDVENPIAVEMALRESNNVESEKEPAATSTTDLAETGSQAAGSSSTGSNDPAPSHRRHSDPLGLPQTDHEVQPSAMGHETCPICIVDFESGDDIRVLPCEGKHQFHQACVDPWLLELSSSCPLCREDFHALETMLSGNDGAEVMPMSPVGESTTVGRSSRFSRYLRSARRRNRDPHTQMTTSTGEEPNISPEPESPA